MPNVSLALDKSIKPHITVITLNCTACVQYYCFLSEYV